MLILALCMCYFKHKVVKVVIPREEVRSKVSTSEFVEFDATRHDENIESENIETP